LDTALNAQKQTSSKQSVKQQRDPNVKTAITALDLRHKTMNLTRITKFEATSAKIPNPERDIKLIVPLK
jgi:hypothetical protein